MGREDSCTSLVACESGVAVQVSVYVEKQGRYEVDEVKLETILPLLMSLRPRAIREHLGLNKPIYARTSAYGHFGRTPDADGGFSWEKTDLVSQLKGAV